MLFDLINFSKAEVIIEDHFPKDDVIRMIGELFLRQFFWTSVTFRVKVCSIGHSEFHERFLNDEKAYHIDGKECLKVDC